MAALDAHVDLRKALFPARADLSRPAPAAPRPPRTPLRRPYAPAPQADLFDLEAGDRVLAQGPSRSATSRTLA
jgi:hypothetical protein